MDGCMGVWRYVGTYVRTYVCMYVCIVYTICIDGDVDYP